MEKVKLPREVADAIKGLQKEGFRPFSIVCTVHEGKNYNDRISVLRRYAIDNDNKLMHALVNGYEVEPTPEEIIKTLFVTPPFTHSKGSYQNGMVDTLNALNINIEGVNT